MILHENRLLADDSHEVSYLIFLQKLGEMSQNLSSVAVVIGAFRVNALLSGLLRRILTHLLWVFITEFLDIIMIDERPFYAPNYKKVERAYCFGLVRPSVRASVRSKFKIWF